MHTFFYSKDHLIEEKAIPVDSPEYVKIPLLTDPKGNALIKIRHLGIKGVVPKATITKTGPPSHQPLSPTASSSKISIPRHASAQGPSRQPLPLIPVSEEKKKQQRLPNYFTPEEHHQPSDSHPTAGRIHHLPRRGELGSHQYNGMIIKTSGNRSQAFYVPKHVAPSNRPRQSMPRHQAIREEYESGGDEDIDYKDGHH